MEQRFRTVLRDFFVYSASAFLLLVVVVYLTIPANLPSAVTAYLLSFIFVGSNYFVIRKIEAPAESKFYKQFFITQAVRFVLVLVALVLVLKGTKFHQIYFTVSFIISYILHSVIEIISINKILETDN